MRVVGKNYWHRGSHAGVGLSSAEGKVTIMDERLVEKIMQAVDANRVKEFERAIVRIPSFTTEETPLATFIADYIRGLGGELEVSLQEISLGQSKVSHNVIAKLSGSEGGKNLLFFGHMDHAPILGREYADEELRGWVHEPFEADIEDGWLYGKGSQDEKGGITGFVMAAEALVRAGVQLRGDVYFVGVQGHKRVSSGTLYLLTQGIDVDYAINSENSGNMIVHAFVGRTEGKIHVRAKELHFHIKDIFPEFRNQLTAFELMNRIQTALGPEMQRPGPNSWMTFEQHPDLADYPQIRMEFIEFRGLHHLTLEFQIRSVPGMTDAGIEADLERLLAQFEANFPNLETEVEWPSQATSRPAVSNDRSHPLVQSLARWHEKVTGRPSVIGSKGRSGAAADGSHTSAAGIDTVLYGPGGGVTDIDYRLRGHLGTGPPDERIALDDIVKTAKVFALTAADLCA